MSEITYTKQGDYLIPDLTLPTEPEIQLGRYALMHRDYLEQHKRVTYLNLLTSGELNKHLYEVEQTALYEVGASDKTALQGAGRDGGTERKAPMQWVGLMNNIRSQAEETILNELILQLNVADEQQVTVNLPTVEEQIEMMLKQRTKNPLLFRFSSGRY